MGCGNFIGNNNYSVDIYWPVEEPVAARFYPDKNETWITKSKILTRTEFENGEYLLRVDNNNNYTSNEVWYDGLILIDLTETFGAGNEPSQEWCDENINWFDGTTTISY